MLPEQLGLDVIAAERENRGHLENRVIHGVLVLPFAKCAERLEDLQDTSPQIYRDCEHAWQLGRYQPDVDANAARGGRMLRPHLLHELPISPEIGRLHWLGGRKRFTCLHRVRQAFPSREWI